jgi:hypothetical protein
LTEQVTQPSGTAAPRLTVVVAALDASESVEACLESLSKQISSEVSVLSIARSGSNEARVASRYGHCLEVSVDVLVPELWTRGILSTRSEWVALTTAQCVPDPDWAASLLASLSGDVIAVGGPIEPGNESPVETAVHLLRYSPYLLPFERHAVSDVPGDNAAYLRTAIEPLSDLWLHGFWENEVNAAMVTRGDTLVMDPRPVVRHRYSGGVATFCRQRFRHGLIFGTARSGRGKWRAALSPAVPAIFLARILRRIRGRPDLGSRFLPASPALLLFLMCWTAGETIGILRGHG